MIYLCITTIKFLCGIFFIYKIFKLNYKSKMIKSSFCDNNCFYIVVVVFVIYIILSNVEIMLLLDKYSTKNKQSYV